MNHGITIIVSGKVQGVCFRTAAQKQAIKLGIKGWVKNLTTGEVEITAVADKPQLEQFIAWCHKGSLFAKVNAVKVTELQHTVAFSTFDILRD